MWHRKPQVFRVSNYREIASLNNIEKTIEKPITGVRVGLPVVVVAFACANIAWPSLFLPSAPFLSQIMAITVLLLLLLFLLLSLSPLSLLWIMLGQKYTSLGVTEGWALRRSVCVMLRESALLLFAASKLST